MRASDLEGEVHEEEATDGVGIISEWAEFARTCIPAVSDLNLVQRRDHIEGMLKEIVIDLDTPQTKREQADKSDSRRAAHRVASPTRHGLPPFPQSHFMNTVARECLRRPALRQMLP